jgi:hypothetical protein
MQLGIKQLASGELELVLGDWRFVAKRQAQSRRATLSTDDGLLIDLEGLSLLDVVGEAGGRSITARRLTADVKLVRAPDEALQVQLGALLAEQLVYRDEQTLFSLERFELPSGLSWAADQVTAPRVLARGGELDMQRGAADHSLRFAAVTATELALDGDELSLSQLELEQAQITSSGFSIGFGRAEVKSVVRSKASRAASAVVEAIELRHEFFQLRSGRIAAGGLKLSEAGDVACSSLVVERSELSAAAVDAKIGRMAATALHRRYAGAFAVSILLFEQVDAESKEGQLFAAQRGEADAVEPTVETASAEHQAEGVAQLAGPTLYERLQLLDLLKGKLCVDIRMHATYPVYGRREAVHRVRLPIDEGAINFKQLEKSLAKLEDAVLDFEVEPGALIFEKDLPLVPFDNQTLVSWPLDEAGQALAEKQQVRLRTLLLAEPKKQNTDAPKEGGAADESAAPGRDRDSSPVSFHDVSLDELLLTLSATRAGGTLALQGGMITVGSDDDPGLDELVVSGSVGWRSEGEPPAGEIALSCKSLFSSFERVAITPALQANGHLSLNGLDAERSKLVFAGLEPIAAKLGCEGIAVVDLNLQPPEEREADAADSGNESRAS